MAARVDVRLYQVGDSRRLVDCPRFFIAAVQLVEAEAVVVLSHLHKTRARGDEAERNIYVVWTMNSGESPKLKVFREYEPANDYLMDMIGKYDDVGWCVFRHDGNRCAEIKI